MKKIIAMFSILITFSAYADIGAEQAMSITAREAFVLLVDHFQLQSPDQLNNSISVASDEALGNIDDQEFKKILQKYPRQTAYYINVQMDDCVVQSMLYIIDKASGQVRATIMIGDEISVDEKASKTL
ncbi:MAG: hypothetical protein A2X86_08650 [Bdellovibrionales bacterium GWA2_49_15]|nr:MAG: hypothetical protein A2X86_08650 [Bdellovibrionales bacterium GWA2_49_15]HAZ11167.1 hypothetical protein [Bdellovibrionales bacterium]